MGSFDLAQEHLDLTRERFPAFPMREVVVGRLLRQISRVLQEQSNALLREFDLHLPQYNVLMMLYGTPGFALTATALGEATGEKLANITRLTNSLFERGLIGRTHGTDDRRKITVKLTRQGQQMLEALLPPMCTLLDDQLAGVTSTELATLERVLKKLLHQLDALPGD